MLKIAMVNAEHRRGGAARMAATLVRTMNDHFEDLEVDLYHCGNGISAHRFHGLKRFGARQINAGLTRLGGSSCVFDFGVANEIIDRTRNADVLHVHNLHSYYLDWKTLLEAWRDRPVVWTWHDQWGGTGRCGFALACDGWKTGCITCPHTDYYPPAWIDFAASEFKAKTDIYDRLTNLCIVSPSEWLADFAIERGFSAERVKVIPNPVDLSVFKPANSAQCRAELGLPIDSFIALFVASDCGVPRKGYPDFVRVVDSTNITGVVVGKPPKTLAEGIIHMGSITSNEKLAQFYSAADVMIFTSTADNYPNTILECTACGTPTIGYRVGGAGAMLEQLVGGAVEAGQVEIIIDRVKEMRSRGNRHRNVAELAAANDSSNVSRLYRGIYEMVAR